MDLQKIKILLQRYYDGESSLEEEDILIGYFLENDVPEEFAKDKEQILGFSDLKNEQVLIPDNLEGSILDTLTPLQNESTVRRLNTRPLYTAISVAASILIIASALVFLNRQPDLGSYDDPELAYAETKEALDMVSKYFTKGTSPISNLNKIESAIKPLNQLEKVETSRKSLEYLKSFDEGIKKTYGLIEMEKSKDK